jgi:hypothetical protein
MQRRPRHPDIAIARCAALRKALPFTSGRLGTLGRARGVAGGSGGGGFRGVVAAVAPGVGRATCDALPPPNAGRLASVMGRVKNISLVSALEDHNRQTVTTHPTAGSPSAVKRSSQVRHCCGQAGYCLAASSSGPLSAARPQPRVPPLRGRPWPSPHACRAPWEERHLAAAPADAPGACSAGPGEGGEVGFDR